MDLYLKRAVVFAILMQGIKHITPQYIEEKVKLVYESEDPTIHLTDLNLDLFNEWEAKWFGSSAKDSDKIIEFNTIIDRASRTTDIDFDPGKE
jgi:hypothetical protein